MRSNSEIQFMLNEKFNNKIQFINRDLKNSEKGFFLCRLHGEIKEPKAIYNAISNKFLHNPCNKCCESTKKAPQNKLNSESIRKRVSFNFKNIEFLNRDNSNFLKGFFKCKEHGVIKESKGIQSVICKNSKPTNPCVLCRKESKRQVHNKISDKEIEIILSKNNKYLKYIKRDTDNSLKAFFECSIHGIIPKSKYLHRYLKYETAKDQYKTCCQECISDRATIQLSKPNNEIQKKSNLAHGFFEFLRRDPGNIDNGIFMCKNHPEKGELTQNIQSHFKGHNVCCPILDTKLVDKEGFQKKTNKEFGEYTFIVKNILPNSEVELMCSYHKHLFTIDKTQHIKNKYGGCDFCKKENQNKTYKSTVTHQGFINEGTKLYPQYVYPDNKIEAYVTKGSCLPVICKEHGVFFTNYYKHIENKYGSGFCPDCTGSIYEKKIKKYLYSKGIRFESQFTFKDCKHIQVLQFDFYIQKYNLLIEFDGHQHVIFPNAYHKTESEFELCRIRDNKKNQYAEGVFNLLRIPELKKESFKDIIDQTIDDIDKGKCIFETAGTGLGV